MRVTSCLAAAVLITTSGLAVPPLLAGAEPASNDHAIAELPPRTLASSSVIDRDGATVRAVLADINVRVVPPLDGNPLSREWFADGRAGFEITGLPEKKLKDSSGQISVGYQIGYQATFNGKLKFRYDTPSLSLNLGTFSGVGVGDLIPQAGVEMSVGFGPGITNVECAKGQWKGGRGFIGLTGIRGSLTGVIGRVNLRPYVSVITSKGDTVITYAEPISF